MLLRVVSNDGNRRYWLATAAATPMAISNAAPMQFMINSLFYTELSDDDIGSSVGNVANLGCLVFLKARHEGLLRLVRSIVSNLI